MKTNFITAKELRVKQNLLSIPGDKPGYYKWYATKDDLEILLNKFDEKFDDYKTFFNKKNDLYCIYVGVAINESLRSRLDWHINQQNTPTAVRTGFLSTLRQSISSLVGRDMSDTESTNNFIDRLYVEYFLTDYIIKSDEAKKQIGDIEKSMLSDDKIYILNIKDNINVNCKNFIKKLKNFRKNAKKIAILNMDTSKPIFEDDTVILREPDINDKNQIMQLREEFLHDGEKINGGSSLEKFEDYSLWLNKLEKSKYKETVPEGLVPQTQFVTVRKSDNKIVGIVGTRQYLNDFLLIHGGHIGDSVIKSERNKGYATRQLKLATLYLKSLGVEKVLITCNKNNIASEKSIIKAGGVFENEVPFDGETYKRFWIETKDYKG